MCCCAGLTSCCGGGCGYCSECVGALACNNSLCGNCMSGTVCCKNPCSPDSCTATSCAPLAGTAVCICTCLPYAGQDSSGNAIYQKSDGSLVYSDGSSATRCDIAYNNGACAGTPCSPLTQGTTDTAPCASGKGKSAGAPQGGGSGGGTAAPAGGKSNPKNTCSSKLSQAMNRFGSTIASLLSGGNKGKVIAGQPLPKATATPISSNAFLLIILIVGGLLLMMAFGHKPGEA
jgi:hypothetical protein